MIRGFNHRAEMSKYRAASAAGKHRDVTRAEFVAAMVGDGATTEKAELQANIAIWLGSHVLIGKELLRIVEVTQ